ncbi:hypothetical protein CC2G_004058 [Coprinopsis cinerea AmutBmut pab1-1]|nr:hypothetical protein CC2G_004058 [Coprinopsis cinerea AmutBmut pab1-1]
MLILQCERPTSHTTITSITNLRNIESRIHLLVVFEIQRFQPAPIRENAIHDWVSVLESSTGISNFAPIITTSLGDVFQPSTIS